jgi:hypothetical protein
VAQLHPASVPELVISNGSVRHNPSRCTVLALRRRLPAPQGFCRVPAFGLDTFGHRLAARSSRRPFATISRTLSMHFLMSSFSLAALLFASSLALCFFRFCCALPVMIFAALASTIF